MKRLALFLFFGLGIVGHTYGQNFPMDEAKWCYSFYVGPFWDPPSSQSFYYVDGDTTINTKVYSKVMYGGSENVQNMTLHSAIREDSGLVYGYVFDSSAEYLLYDFTLSVSDTFILEYWTWDGDPDTFLVDANSTPPSYYELYQPNNCQLNERLTWRQGVGAMYGFYEQISSCSVSGMTPLSCFYQYGAQVHSGPGGHCGITGINEHNLRQKLEVFPNPVRDVLHVEATSENYTVYDNVGRPVMHGTISNGQIDVSELSEGVYTILTDSGHGRIVKM